MYCSKCGKKIADDISYCPYCGCQLREKEYMVNGFKPNIKEVYIFIVWFLLNTLLYMIIDDNREYSITNYQISTFIAPLIYYLFRIGVKYLLSKYQLSKDKKVLIKIGSILLGGIPVFFIIIPVVIFLRMLFGIARDNVITWVCVLTVICVELFYRDLFIDKVINDSN